MNNLATVCKTDDLWPKKFNGEPETTHLLMCDKCLHEELERDEYLIVLNVAKRFTKCEKCGTDGWHDANDTCEVMKQASRRSSL